ncbi:MAG TPA: hypothetical protein VGI39_33095 [Polyangiaceae bacterium]|jgi:hypothetical protein
MFAARRLVSPLSLALMAALHASFLPCAVAFADTPKPSGAAKLPSDLIARGLSLFEDQQYEESIQTLSAALVRPNNTAAQKIEIYRLLALNYITLQHKEEAEAAVRGLLSLQPSYELPVRESPRFRDFFAAAKQRWEAEGRPGLVKESEPPPAPVTMKHASPSEAKAGDPIALSASLDDPQSRVAEVKLFYRTGSAGKFAESVASLGDRHVSATIPKEAVKPAIVEYYLQGLDKGGLPIVSRGDAAAPLRIPVPERGGGWVLPTVVGVSVAVVAGAVVGGLAAGGVFNSSPAKGGGTVNNPPPGPGSSTVTVVVGQPTLGAHW